MTRRTSVRLAELCEVGCGNTPPRKQMERYYKDGDIPWVKSGELREGLITTTEERITAAAVRESHLKRVPKGAILLALHGTRVGRLALLGIEATTNQAVCHIVPDSSAVDTRFLFHAIAGHVHALSTVGSDGAPVQINPQLVGDWRIHLPPLREQRRIAALLDKVDVLREERRRFITAFDSFALSLFTTLFGDLLSNPKAWPQSAALGEIAEIMPGLDPRRRISGATRRVVSTLGGANIRDRFFDGSTFGSIEASDVEIRRLCLQQDDLLLCARGSTGRLGQGALWTGQMPECIPRKHVFRVRLKTEHYNPIFLNWMLDSEWGQQHFERSAKRATAIPSINMAQLESFPLLFPPLEHQACFADTYAAMAGQHQLNRAALVELDAYFIALRQRVHRGEAL